MDWNKASLFAKRNWLGALVLLLVVLSVVGVIRLISDQNNAAEATCERGNTTRPQTIHVYLAIAKGNDGRHDAARELLQSPETENFPPDIIDYLKGDLHAASGEAVALRHAAFILANTQVPVSQHPNSPDLEKRALVDCDAAT